MRRTPAKCSSVSEGICATAAFARAWSGVLAPGITVETPGWSITRALDDATVTHPEVAVVPGEATAGADS